MPRIITFSERMKGEYRVDGRFYNSSIAVGVLSAFTSFVQTVDLLNLSHKKIMWSFSKRTSVLGDIFIPLLRRLPLNVN